MVRIGEGRIRANIRFYQRAIDDTERMIADNERQIESYGDRHGQLSYANGGLKELLAHYHEQLEDAKFELEVL